MVVLCADVTVDYVFMQKIEFKRYSCWEGKLKSIGYRKFLLKCPLSNDINILLWSTFNWFFASTLPTMKLLRHHFKTLLKECGSELLMFSCGARVADSVPAIRLNARLHDWYIREIRR